MIMHCIPLALSQCFMQLDVCLIIENCVLVGLDWASTHDAIIFSTSHVHAYPFFCFFVHFCDCVLFLSLSLSRIYCAWHPSVNLILLETLFVPSLLRLLTFPFPLFTFGFVMRRPIRTSLRTFLNVAFIRSTM